MGTGPTLKARESRLHWLGDQMRHRHSLQAHERLSPCYTEPSTCPARGWAMHPGGTLQHHTLAVWRMTVG